MEDAKSPPAEYLEFDNSTTISVQVGPQKHPFTIHRGPICKLSGYFKAVFEGGNFKESSEKVITLPDHKRETFDEFLYYAYYKQLKTRPYVQPEAEEQWMQYGALYVLADYLTAVPLKNEVLHRLFSMVVEKSNREKSSGITANVINYVYGNTPRGCGIRRLMVAQTIWGSKHESFRQADALEDLDTALSGLHEDFVAEVAAQAMRRVWDGETRDPMKNCYGWLIDKETAEET